MLLFSEIPNWTEEQLDEMGSDEHDFLEFKCSRYLEEEGEINPFFLDGLSKQLSAFSNGAGGRIVIGIDDHGNVDGGVKTNLKGGGTRSWLEDVIHTLVSPRLAEFNVFEVLGSQETSKILPGHAVYVLEIAESKDAPHQARDHRYYLRIAGKSRPMGHVHVQDVIRRTRNPRVTLARMGPYGEPELDEGDVRGRRVFVGFRILLVNQGATLANHVGAEVILPRQLVGGEVRKRILQAGDVHYTQRPGEVAFFRYHPRPVFPEQELFFLMFWVGIHKANVEAIQGGAAVGWRVYADDAEPREGSEVLWRFTTVRSAVALLHPVAHDAQSGG